jgi:hypothetical protein
MSGYTDSTGRFIPTRQSIVALPFSGFEIAAGTPLAAFANGASTTPGVAFDNAKAAGVRWNNDAAPAAMYAAVLLPRHRKPKSDIIVHILAAKSGNTGADATTFAINAWAQTNGALQDAASDAGGTTGAMVGAAAAKTMQHVQLTLSGTNLPDVVNGLPSVLTLGVKPTAGTLGTDDVTISAIWLEFTESFVPLLPPQN